MGLEYQTISLRFAHTAVVSVLPQTSLNEVCRGPETAPSSPPPFPCICHSYTIIPILLRTSFGVHRHPPPHQPLRPKKTPMIVAAGFQLVEVIYIEDVVWDEIHVLTNCIVFFFLI